MFAYSMRERTHAWHKLKDDVDEETKMRRLREVIDTFRSVAMQRSKEKDIGSERLVLVEVRQRRLRQKRGSLLAAVKRTAELSSRNPSDIWRSNSRACGGRLCSRSGAGPCSEYLEGACGVWEQPCRILYIIFNVIFILYSDYSSSSSSSSCSSFCSSFCCCCCCCCRSHILLLLSAILFLSSVSPVWICDLSKESSIPYSFKSSWSRDLNVAEDGSFGTREICLRITVATRLIKSCSGISNVQVNASSLSFVAMARASARRTIERLHFSQHPARRAPLPRSMS